MRRPLQNPERIILRLGQRPTAREQQVIALMAEGLTNAEIAIGLDISSETIKSHVKHALARLGCRSRTELVNVAWKRGMLPYNEEWIEDRLSLISSRLSGREPND